MNGQQEQGTSSPSLRSVQIWGILTKAATVGLGIIQTAIILRILSPAQYGIVGIIVSLGSLIGVSQHVGVVDAAIREIAAATDARRRAHVFWVSLWFRMAITVPLSFLLLILAPWIETRFYPFPGVTYFLQLSSIILILQGLQGIVGGAYTGKLAFGRLYRFQVGMALVNVPIFVGMTWWRGIGGYFEGVILSTGLFVLLLSLGLRSALGGILVHPSRSDMGSVLRDILHTGVWTYIARILSVAWQRVPLLLLGRWAPPETVGLFNVALTFGSKLVILASAIGEVNLAFLSSAFASSRDAFRAMARRTAEDVGITILLGAGLLSAFTDILLTVFAGPEYREAARVTMLVTWGYAAFAFVDIVTNTFFVPSRRSNARAGIFLVLVAGTSVTMWLFRATPLTAAGMGTLIGGCAALLVTEFVARRHALSLLTGRVALLGSAVIFLTVLAAANMPLSLRLIVTLAIYGLAAWGLLARLRGSPSAPASGVSNVR
jgi:O-antigen/teichoic acid export membrane protein